MGQLNLRSLAMALAMGFLLATGAGCSGDENPCDDVECSDGEVCNQNTGVCEDRCAGVSCDEGEVCNPSNGQCAAPDLCKDVSCNETESCNPANGQCESKCKPGSCGATESCVPTTGECVAKCESNTKPAGKSACGEGQICETNTGNCVSACKDKTCPYAQWCDANDGGKCKPKSGPGSSTPPAGYPGTACTNVNDCFNQDIGGTQECLQEFPLTSGTLPAPGGYCTNTCGTDADCAPGSICIGVCISSCAGDADCRDGYRCSPLGEGEFACLPASTCTSDECSPLGGDCETAEDCEDGGFCLAESNTNQQGQEFYSGFLGGYCTWVKRSTDFCPAGSTGLRADPDDPTIEFCVKDCTFGEVGACGADEACQPVAINQQTGAIDKAVCLYADCSVNEDCQVAQCTATNKNACGAGQDCVNENGDPVTGTTVGTCSTQDRCGGNFGNCRFGECSDDGLCVESFCEPTLGLCMFDCRAAPEGVDACGEGATCGADGACVRGCVDDLACGPNAVCGAGNECVPRCHRWNEESVCGDAQVCNYDTGHCQAPCTAGSCGSGEVCVEDTGRCQRACNAALDPRTCGSNEYCDDGGFCQTKCTRFNENSVCDPGNADPAQATFCQVSTGRCLPNCAADPTICGDEACSVSSTLARCGQTCTTSQNCGTGAYNEVLTCQGPSNARTCAPVECDAENPCGALGVCNNGVCENTCTDDEQCGPGRVCGTGTPRVCEDAPPPPTCDVDPSVCDENTEFCNAANECELRCDAPGAADCGAEGVCDAESGQCVASCNAAQDPTVCDAGEDFVCGESGHCIKSCDAAADATVCDADEDFVCGESGLCVKTCDAAVDPTVCDADEDFVCGASGVCIKTCDADVDPTVCDAAEDFVCGASGVCIKSCDAAEEPTVCDDACDNATGLCIEGGI